MSLQEKMAIKHVLIFIVLQCFFLICIQHFLNFNIFSLNVVRVLLYVQLGMTLYALYINHMYYQTLGFGPINYSALTKYIPLYVLLLYTFIKLSLHSKHTLIFYQALLMSLFIAVSEQVIFRGLLFQTLLKKRSFLSSAVISSCLFAGLHSLNFIVSGNNVSLNLWTIGYAFILGLTYCIIAHEINSIAPLMIIDWLWQFTYNVGPLLHFPIDRLKILMFIIEGLIIMNHAFNNPTSNAETNP